MSITLVQSNSSHPAGTPGTCAFSTNVTAGNLLLIGINWGNSTGTYAITDTLGNTWTQFPSVPTGISGLNDLNAFWTVSASSGANTVTATISGGGAHGLRLAVYEYSSTTGWPANPVDGTGNKSSSLSGVTTANPGNITPSASGELVVSYIQFGNTTSADAVSTPFTERPTAGGTAGTGWTSDGRADGADDQSSGNTALTCTWSWVTAVAYSALICAFKPAAAVTFRPDEDLWAVPKAQLAPSADDLAAIAIRAIPMIQADELPQAPQGGGLGETDVDYWLLLIVQPSQDILNVYS